MATQNPNPNPFTPGSKAAALAARIRDAKENVAALRELWVMLLGEPSPDDRQFIIWLKLYDFDTVSDAIDATAQWLSKFEQALALIQEDHVDKDGKLVLGRTLTQEQIDAAVKTLLDKIRYASGVMSKKKKKADDGRPCDQL
jgi:hypothetical protein